VARTRILLASVAAVILGAVVFFVLQAGAKKESEILVLCGSSMRSPMEEIIEDYKRVSDHNVLMTVGGSAELCAQLRHTKKGDIYVCHDPFMPWAEKLGLVDEWGTVGSLKVVIAVPRGNPKGVRSLEDLARPGLRVGIGDVRYSTSGVMTNEILKEADFGAGIRKNIKMMAHSHQKRATDVALGILDATIMWDAVAFLFRDRLDVIPIKKTYVDAVTSATFGRTDLRNIQVTVGMTTYARDKEHVRRFYEYVTTEGRAVFEKNGFTPAGSP
jgi:molybdate transport system substrate-binding protein